MIALVNLKVAAYVGGVEERLGPGGLECAAGLIVLRIVILCPVLLRLDRRVDDGVIKEEIVGANDRWNADGTIAEAVAAEQAVGNNAVELRWARGVSELL